MKHPTATSTSYLISVTINKYCKDLNVKTIFSPFKLSTMFSPKDFVPDSLKSSVVYQFSCVSCGARCIGETNRHFNTRVNEHLFRDKIATFLNISVLLKIVGLSAIFLVLRFSILPSALILNLKWKRAVIFNSWNLNSTNKLSMLVCRCISKFISTVVYREF